MRHGLFSFVLAFVLCFPSFGRENVQTVKSLRLIPYPKQVIKSSGEFRLDRPLRLQAPEAVIRVVAAWIGEELKGAGFGRPISRGNPTRSQQKADVIFLSPLGRTLEPTALAMPAAAGLRSFRQGATEEDYRLCVRPDGVLIAAKGPAGLLHGAATLCQLIRANRRGAAIPCLQIDDWPSLRWRAFQDDLTRGPSTRLEQLKRDVARGALLKLNIFTYYMEYQFAYSRHPKIGPPDGSLTPQELAALVRHAQPLGVHILGNQQSFAHMHHILAMEDYAHLREDERTLSPVKEETYRFLDDLYADVLPLLPFEFFNVCCDETWGLGTKGPSQELAERIGPGGVYVRHLLRVHELVHGKYGKRMMMWGDIILKYPEELSRIPKDVVMLTWGYAPRESFENQIVPFAKSGFEFFVCPGVSNWRRVLPHFRNSVVNIQNFVRDGAKHGALGMLNTSWDDDGENLNAPNWYGFAWGAECAWNASNTPVEEFNRRVGAVLFGEPGDHFGRAIELLSEPGVCGLLNSTFWGADSPLVRPSQRADAVHHLKTVQRAIEHLQACQDSATADADLLDAVLFGARRIGFHYRRMIERMDAAQAYAQAGQAETTAEAVAKIDAVTETVRGWRETYRSLRQKWSELWHRENKPYALDWSLRRYDRAIDRCDQTLAKLQAARKAAAAGGPLPPAHEVGLALWSRPKQLARPAQIESSLGHYRDYFPEFAFDGNQETFYWSDRGLRAGDHFTLRFRQPVRLNRVRILMGTQRYRSEFVHTGTLEVSTDGRSWKPVAPLSRREQHISLPNTPIQALRLRVEKAQRNWLIIREIVVQ